MSDSRLRITLSQFPTLMKHLEEFETDSGKREELVRCALNWIRYEQGHSLPQLQQSISLGAANNDEIVNIHPSNQSSDTQLDEMPPETNPMFGNDLLEL